MVVAVEAVVVDEALVFTVSTGTSGTGAGGMVTLATRVCGTGGGLLAALGFLAACCGAHVRTLVVEFLPFPLTDGFSPPLMPEMKDGHAVLFVSVFHTITVESLPAVAKNEPSLPKAQDVTEPLWPSIE